MFRMLSFVALLGLSAAAFAADKYTLDPVHSSVVFRITHLNTSAAYGRFNDPTGTVTVDGDKVSLDVTVQAAKVDTANQQRDDHLRGPDFFNAKEFPTITFKTTASTKKDDKTYEVTGNITLLGKSRPATVQLRKIGEGKDFKGNPIVGFETLFTMKRSDFGMNFMPDMLGDEVTLAVSVEAVKAAK